MKTQVDRDIKGKTSLHDTKFQPVILFTGKKTISQNLNFQTKKFTARQPFPPTPLPPKKKKERPNQKMTQIRRVPRITPIYTLQILN